MESFIRNKDGSNNPCGDAIVISDYFYAVIDGVTPKGNMLWDNQRSDIYVSQLLNKAIKRLPKDIKAKQAIELLNQTITNEYLKRNIDINTLNISEQLRASIIIYSKYYQEVWNFGDCKLRINDTSYDHHKVLDELFADLRLYFNELNKVKGIDTIEDYGREMIIPYMKENAIFANTDSIFSFPVLNGLSLNLEQMKVYPVNKGDYVVLASDGYPKLFKTLKESEDYLHKCIMLDPKCMGIIKGTKAIKQGNESYDDRSYIGFVVE